MFLNIVLISTIDVKIKRNLVITGIVNTLLLMLIEMKTGVLVGTITYFMGIMFGIINFKKISLLEQMAYSTLVVIGAFLISSLLFDKFYNINMIKKYLLEPQLYYFIKSVSKFEDFFKPDIYQMILDAFKYQATIFIPTIVTVASAAIAVILLFISKKIIDKNYSINISKLSVRIKGDTILIYSYIALLFFSSDLEAVILLKNVIYIVTILYFIQGCYVFDYLSKQIPSLSQRISLYLVLVTMLIFLPAVIVTALPYSVFLIKELMEVLITIVAILGIVDSNVNIRRLG